LILDSGDADIDVQTSYVRINAGNGVGQSTNLIYIRGFDSSIYWKEGTTPGESQNAPLL
jgi:hypothetical protein